MLRSLTGCLLFLTSCLVSFSQTSSSKVNLPGEPPELAGEPKKLTPPSDTLRQLASIMEKWKENDAESVKVVRPELDSFIRQHPEFGDGYAIRALADGCYIKSKNYDEITNDINTALSTSQPDHDNRMFSAGDLYGYRARIAYEMGRERAAIDDLEKAMRQNIDNADKIFNSGGTKPEANSGRCAWNLSDLDSLVRKFPNDYRPTLFRALYLSFFTTFDEKYFQQAVLEFQKSATLNPKSPLPHYFIGGLYVRSAFWSKAAWTSDAVRDEAHRKAALSYSRAIELDPKFLDAYVQRANAYYQLKQSRQAVKDYDQALQLDPENESAYHDRALAKMDLGEYYSAISDFSDSIRRKKETSDSLFSKLAYENRADAYMKVGDYSSAISDLDKAIERELANDSFLMNLRTFRLIYPEYEQLPDAALVEKVRVLFWPGFTHEVLSKQLTENKDFTSTGLADLYVKRGDAYLRAKDFRKAGAEYNRAFAGFGEYGKATDRWRLFASPRTDEFYIDVKTLDFGESGPARLWMKVVSKKPTYSIDAYEVDCKARRLNQVSTAIYDSSDNLVRTNELLDGWQRIIPDTIGEDLYAGMCSRP